MRKIIVALAGTASGLVLLFSYYTSTSGVAASGPTGSDGVEPGTTTATTGLRGQAGHVAQRVVGPLGRVVRRVGRAPADGHPRMGLDQLAAAEHLHQGAVRARHLFVWLSFTQTLATVIEGCERAWEYTAVRISACTARRRPLSGSGSSPSRPKSS
jgi:hypothetical protein